MTITPERWNQIKTIFSAALTRFVKDAPRDSRLIYFSFGLVPVSYTHLTLPTIYSV